MGLLFLPVSLLRPVSAWRPRERAFPLSVRRRGVSSRFRTPSLGRGRLAALTLGTRAFALKELRSGWRRRTPKRTATKTRAPRAETRTRRAAGRPGVSVARVPASGGRRPTAEPLQSWLPRARLRARESLCFPSPNFYWYQETFMLHRSFIKIGFAL